MKTACPCYFFKRHGRHLDRYRREKDRLDARRPIWREALLALQESYDVDLTYTSNAIEGKTLTLRETAELIEHGITVGVKPLREPLPATSFVYAG